jgi:acyl carrier protein
MGVEEEFDTYVPMSNELQEVRNLHDLIKVVAEQMAREAAEKAAAKG